MLQYPLDQLLATVPRCFETSSLSTLVEIFAREQCDRLVVINQQQFPIGMLYSVHFTQKLLAAIDEDRFFSIQQPLSNWQTDIIQPVQTIPETQKLEKLVCHWRCGQNSENSSPTEWALTDEEGKFLGLLDNARLLQLLVQEKSYITGVGSQESEAQERSLSGSGQESYHNQYQPLIQLLEKLPWPLMLQTDTGVVVTQNLAWWQQLGILKDPKEVSKQVESILSPHDPQEQKYHQQQNNQQKVNFYTTKQQNSPNLSNQANSTSHCFLNTHLGTCTCVVEVQNGSEQVWQFAKIPLNSSDVKMDWQTNESGVNTNNLWLILATDITEQQQLCKELAAKNADLIQLNRLKDEFLACISHELKTPLTAVLGLSRLLADQNLGELNERQARYAGLIHQSGRHLMCVVNDILDLTRMETGQMELTLTNVKIRTVCERALAEIKTLNSQSSKTAKSNPNQNPIPADPQFNLTIEPGLEQMVADELRLRQMLVHLLSNAFKFTKTSGEIGLRVNHWEGWIAFTVWDTGIGIPEHQQHLIFQKFQQLENPLTRQFEGTGLGLFLTRALARLHGGDVSFLSREGKGSQFTLLLPPAPPKLGHVVESPERYPAIAQTISESLVEQQIRKFGQKLAIPPLNGRVGLSLNQPIFSQRLVLVVEAVAQYIEDLSEHLKNLGYRVVIARSGTEAIEKARRLQPKAIFLNPLLPLLSGWDVLTLLKSDQATSHIPIIVTATGAEKEQAFANGTAGFLNLPIEPQMLIPLLEQLCAVPDVQLQGLEKQATTANKVILRILRLVNPTILTLNPHPSLNIHRVIEVDDLDQAEILARVWQFDVVLLDVESSIAQVYLQKLTNYPRLISLPLVTCDVATTLAASQIPGLSVFPYLTPLGKENGTLGGKTDDLLSVLQIAAGICCPPNILVVDFTMLRDLPQIRRKQAKGYNLARNSSLNAINGEYGQVYSGRGAEWLQALIQYLKTAGLKATIGRCWAEVLQQIHHQSVDLLLICLGDTAIHKEVQKALHKLTEPSLKLPPILIIDQRSHSASEIENGRTWKNSDSSSSLAGFVGGVATQILPRSISMEDLLNQINLVTGNRS